MYLSYVLVLFFQSSGITGMTCDGALAGKEVRDVG